MRTAQSLIALLLCCSTLMLAQPATQPQPQKSTASSPTPKKHKVLGIVMIVGGVALIGVSALAFSRPCPAQDRAAQISQQTHEPVAAGICGSSWLENHKTTVGVSTAAAGAALIISGAIVVGK